VRPATQTTLKALLGTMGPTEERATELMRAEERVTRPPPQLLLNEVEAAMYGEVVAKKMQKVAAAYEVPGRTHAQMMPLIQSIVKLCDVCDFAGMLWSKCQAFCTPFLAPFVFGRLLHKGILFNRHCEYEMDVQQLFIFLTNCF
jgi:hypothetical protein